MRTLIDFAILQEYDRVKKRGDKLVEIGSMIDWEAFRVILDPLFKNKGENGGRPNIDVVIMLKHLVIQQWKGLSDPALEREVADRISFRVFLGTTEVIPDFSTVWLFRKRLAESGKDKEIWDELQRQMDAMGYAVIEGTVQDATFITSDPGRNHKKKPESEKAKEDSGTPVERLEFDHELLEMASNLEEMKSKAIASEEIPTSEGSWAKKGSKSFFGYKGHISIDGKYQLIRKVETTTASVHDSQVDLGVNGLPNYRDKGYSGAKCVGYDAAMVKATRGHGLSIQDILRNKRIGSKRGKVERCFSVMKRVFKAGHVMVTTVKRAGVKIMMNSFVYNLYQLRTLAKKRLA
jgi:IS5 family transposase